MITATEMRKVNDDQRKMYIDRYVEKIKSDFNGRLDSIQNGIEPISMIRLRYDSVNYKCIAEIRAIISSYYQSYGFKVRIKDDCCDGTLVITLSWEEE